MYHEIFQLQANTFKALANPKRLEIINLLRDQKLNVNQIIDMLDLPQANLSQHLSVLKSHGILSSQKKGKEVFYAVTSKKFVTACDLIREILIHDCDDKDLAKIMKKDIESFLPLAHDPVCGMRISPKFASFVHKHENETYFFCASGCLQVFKSNPKAYVQQS